MNCFKESVTGLDTGVEDFIRANAPVALNMPAATYDQYFVGPWATEREHEAKHRELTKSIGESLRGKIWQCLALDQEVSLLHFNFRTWLFLLFAVVWHNPVQHQQGDNG